MKRFTVFITMALLIAGGMLKGQDIGISSFANVFTGDSVYPNIQVQLSYIVTNFGSTSVASTDADSVTRVILVNGVPVDSRGLTFAAMGPGGNSGAITTNYFLNWATYSLSAGSISVCCKTIFWKSGVNGDVNQANDEFCQQPIYSGNGNIFTYDLTIENVSITSPIVFNSIINQKTKLNQIGFDLKNASAVKQIPAGLGFEVNMTCDGSTFSAPGTTNAMSPGGSVPYTSPSVLNKLNFPTTNKSFDICLELINDPGDVNQANDKSCTTYEQKFVGIDETAVKESMKIFYANNLLNIDLVADDESSYKLNVISVTGQVGVSQNLNSADSKSYKIALDNLIPGFYIANITSNTGENTSYKFIKK